jgi:hypothetical protein
LIEGSGSEVGSKVAAAAKDPKEAETMLSGKLEAEEASSAAAAGDRKEFKLAMFHVSFFLSAGVLFTLLSFLVPGASRRFQILCWQTAIVSFVSAVRGYRPEASRGLVRPPRVRRAEQEDLSRRCPCRPLVTVDAACWMKSCHCKRVMMMFVQY